MTCAACVRRVENALNSVEGVVESSVNLTTGRATVIHSAEGSGLTELEKVVTGNGYEFLGELKDNLADPLEASRIKELNELKLKVSCGAILSFIIFMGSMQRWFGFLDFIPRQIMLWVMFYSDCSSSFLGRQPFFYRRLQSRATKNIRHEHISCCRCFFGLCLFSDGDFLSAIFYYCGSDTSCLFWRRGNDSYSYTYRQASGS